MILQLRFEISDVNRAYNFYRSHTDVPCQISKINGEKLVRIKVGLYRICDGSTIAGLTIAEWMASA